MVLCVVRALCYVRTCRQVWLPFCYNFGHHFVTLSVSIAIRMISVHEATPCRHQCEAVWSCTKSHRTFGQGGKSYPVHTTAERFLLGVAEKLSGSYREAGQKLLGGCLGGAGKLSGSCRGAAGSCQEAVRELPGGFGKFGVAESA